MAIAWHESIARVPRIVLDPAIGTPGDGLGRTVPSPATQEDEVEAGTNAARRRRRFEFIPNLGATLGIFHTRTSRKPALGILGRRVRMAGL